MTNRPLILITNDDGIRSPGLLAAANACTHFGDILIAAPVVQQSGAGRSKLSTSGGRIFEETLQLAAQTVIGYAIEGTPAQVVEHALIELATRRVTLAVSGINYGENIGEGITVSGTVGAAMEAVSLGVPALAVSLQTAPEHYYTHSTDVDFQVAGLFVQRLVALALARGLPPGADLLKIDIPKGASPATPLRWTRSSRLRYFHPVAPQRTQLSDPTPMNFRTGFDPERLEADSDVHAVIVDAVVSVTPIHLDMTAPVAWATLDAWLDE